MKRSKQLTRWTALQMAQPATPQMHSPKLLNRLVSVLQALWNGRRNRVNYLLII